MFTEHSTTPIEEITQFIKNNPEFELSAEERKNLLRAYLSMTSRFSHEGLSVLATTLQPDILNSLENQ